MENQKVLLNKYLNYISNPDLKSSFKEFLYFFEELKEFEVQLFYKEKLKMHDVRIFNKSLKLQLNFGRTKQPFSMVVYQDYFSFYVRGKNNVFRDFKLCNEFTNCETNNSGELIFKLTNFQEISSLLKYIFTDTLKLKGKIKISK